jgi:hypothetical protein
MVNAGSEVWVVVGLSVATGRCWRGLRAESGAHDVAAGMTGSSTMGSQPSLLAPHRLVPRFIVLIARETVRCLGNEIVLHCARLDQDSEW